MSARVTSGKKICAPIDIAASVRSFGQSPVGTVS
jgi:hypothetical protein